MTNCFATLEHGNRANDGESNERVRLTVTVRTLAVCPPLRNRANTDVCVCVFSNLPHGKVIRYICAYLLYVLSYCSRAFSNPIMMSALHNATTNERVFKTSSQYVGHLLSRCKGDFLHLHADIWQLTVERNVQQVATTMV